MKKETMFMIGAGVLGFVAVRYFLKNKNKEEQSSNFSQNNGKAKKTYSSACGCGA